MTQEFMISHLELECAGVPFVIKISVVGMDKSQLLV